MESSPWLLIDKTLNAKKVVGAYMDLVLEDCGTSLPDEPRDRQIFTLVDSLTVPIYMWTFRYNIASISYRWEFVGGLGTTLFDVDSNTSLDKLTSTGFKNTFDDVVYYKSGSMFPLPYSGEYEFTGGVVIESPSDDLRISTQIVYRYRNQTKLGLAWPLGLKRGFNHIPLPLKRLSGLNPGKIALGVGSTAPSETMVHWSSCVVRPVKIQ